MSSSGHSSIRMFSSRVIHHKDDLYYIDQNERIPCWKSQQLEEFHGYDTKRGKLNHAAYHRWEKITDHLNTALYNFGAYPVDYECSLFKTDKQRFFLLSATALSPSGFFKPNEIHWFPKEWQVSSCELKNKKNEHRKNNRILFHFVDGMQLELSFPKNL